MSNRNSITCLAKQFCDGLWNSFTNKYPAFVNRISPTLVHLAIYQHLINHPSIIGSKGRQRQQELVESFEQWYEGIELARAIDWIDIDLDVIDIIRAETGDYSYYFNESGSFIRNKEPNQTLERSINHQLFQVLPTATSSVVVNNNQNQEIVKQIKSHLLNLVSSPINSSIPGEQELFSLMVDDISRLLIGFPRDEYNAKDLGSYLYLFQSAALGNHKTKHECAQLEMSIHASVYKLQYEGGAPQHIDPVWKKGLGYSDELVKDYNQLISILDSQVFTVNREDITDGFELSVWRYPDKEKTQQKIILRGDGHFELMGEKPLIFDDARAIEMHLMSMTKSDS